MQIRYKFLFIILLVLWAGPSFAANCGGAADTYYVDYVAGDDTNNGTATGTPWQHHPGDRDAANTADCDLIPGDTVVFKGGVVYAFDAPGAPHNYIDSMTSGTSGNVITYISGHAHASEWPNTTDRAEIDCTNATPKAGGVFGVINLGAKAYITVEGLEMYALAESPATHFTAFIGWGSGGSTYVNANIIIDDCVLYHGNSNGIYIKGTYSTSTNVPENFIVQNCDIDDVWATGINPRYGLENVLIYNNTIDHCGTEPYGDEGEVIGNPIGLAGYGHDIDFQYDVTIRGNTIGDSDGLHTHLGAGAPAEPTGNKGLINIQRHQISLTIEDNYFHGKPNIGSPHFVGGGEDFIFRNNVWNIQTISFEGILRIKPGPAAVGFDIDGLSIYNNTFIGIPHSGSRTAAIWFSAQNLKDYQVTNCDIRNNIIYTEDSDGPYLITIMHTEDGSDKPVVDMATFTCDYNAYYSIKGGTGEDDGDKFFAGARLDSAGEMTFTEWKAYLAGEGVAGADANSQWGQVSFIDASNEDFNLSATDQFAIDLGTDLSGIGAPQQFNDDKDGTARGATWEIGAYTFTPPGGDTPSVPAGSSILGNTAGGAAIGYNSSGSKIVAP